MPRSKITSQGQISIPAEIRTKLGVGAGSTLEWEEEGDRVFVKRAGTFSSEDIHRALFSGEPPKTHTLDELKQGVRQRMRERYARH